MKFIGSGFEHLNEFFSSLIIWELMTFFAFMIEDINKKLKDNVEDSSLATVAKTGSYKDLAYKPVIPTVPRKVSSFQNDSEYLNIENENERIFVLIACTANPSNWAEWTAVQKGFWEAGHNTDEQSESNDV